MLGLFAAGLLASSAAGPIYVSQFGNDAWTGRFRTPAGQDGPKRTLAGARDELRRLRIQGQAVREIVLLPGRYEQTTSLRLLAADGGTASAPTVIRAETAGTVVVSGSALLISWRPANRSEAPWMAPGLEGRLVRHDLTPWAQSLRERGHRTWNEDIKLEPLGPFLTQNRAFLNEARWPNTGWAKVASVAPGNAPGAPAFTANLSGMRTPAGAKGLWLTGCISRFKWMMYHEPIRSINPATGRIDITLPMPHHLDGGRQAELIPGEEGRFAIVNSPWELDAPGEWWIDLAAKAAYWLPTGSSAGAALATVSGPVIEIDKSAHIRLEGLDIEGGQQDGIRMENSQNIVLSNLKVTGVGYWGVRILGGSNCRVEDTLIRQTGEGGVFLDGGSQASLTPAGHVVQNCVIREVGRAMAFYRPPVQLKGVGMTVRQSTLTESPHTGIIFNGNSHVIERNLITRVCLDSNDAAAVYGWSDWSSRGTIIRNNVIRDIRNPIPVGFEVFGVYLDGSRSGTRIERNLIERVDSAINLGSGFDNTAEGNVIVNCPFGISIDSPDSAKDEIEKARRTVPVGSPLWRSSFPTLAALQDGGDPKRTPQARIRGNWIMGAREALRGPRMFDGGPVDQKDNRVQAGVSPVTASALGFDPATAGARLLR